MNIHLWKSTFDPEHHLTLGEVVILNADLSIRPIIEFLSPSNVAIFIPNLSSVWFKTMASFPNSLPDSWKS